MIRSIVTSFTGLIASEKTSSLILSSPETLHNTRPNTKGWVSTLRFHHRRLLTQLRTNGAENSALFLKVAFPVAHPELFETWFGSLLAGLELQSWLWIVKIPKTLVGSRDIINYKRHFLFCRLLGPEHTAMQLVKTSKGNVFDFCTHIERCFYKARTWKDVQENDLQIDYYLVAMCILGRMENYIIVPLHTCTSK